jgi:hypothetical protein
MLRLLLVLGTAAAAVACRASGPVAADAGADAAPGADEGAGCAPGLQAQGPACAPILGPCPDDQRPLRGGGCQRVGPPLTCLDGWAVVDGSRCEPLLPPATCDEDQLEVLGQTACQLVGDCGSDPYGNITILSSTIFVNQAYLGGGSDGSKARPFATLGAALAAAPPGAPLAVAAGTYQEDLALRRAVQIEGRCPGMVKIEGQGVNPFSAVEIYSDGVTLRGLSVSGPNEGISVAGATATLERVIVTRCQNTGIVVAEGGELIMKGSLLFENRPVGLSVSASKATVDQTVIRDTRPTPATSFGAGVTAYAKSGPTALTMRDSLVSGSVQYGIAVFGGQATLERTIVRGTLSAAAKDTRAAGVVASPPPGASPPDLVMRDCVVAENHELGVAVLGSSATLERTVVRDTLPDAVEQRRGVGVQAGRSSNQASTVTMRDSLVAGNRMMGIGVWGSHLTLERTVVRDTQSELATGDFGNGIYAKQVDEPATLIMTDCVVSRNRYVGVGFQDSQATLKGSVVSHTLSQAADNGGGWGISAIAGLSSSTLTMEDCLVQDSRGAGVQLYASRGVIRRSTIRDNHADDVQKHYGDGIQVSVLDSGKQPAELRLEDSLVQDSARAGLLVLGSGGTAARSVFRGGVFAIDLEQGATLDIAKDNLYLDNKENQVTMGSDLKPSPLPDVPAL